jgi:hypothetical protein
LVFQRAIKGCCKIQDERNYAQDEGRMVQDSLGGGHSPYCTSHLLDE